MGKIKIKLTIQEIIADFESLVRHDERLDVLFDFSKADEDTIESFHDEVHEMAGKYIPNYLEHVPEEYFCESSSAYDRALILYGMLYENFKEIFSQLV